MDGPQLVEDEEKNRQITRLTPFELIKLIIDLLLSIVDAFTDLLLIYNLLLDKRTRDWGYLAVGFEWFPGLLAFMYIISKQRTRYPFKKVMLFSCLVFIVYPVVPTGAYLYFWYNAPKSRGHNDKHFEEAKTFVAAIRGITGCVEKPLQLIFQVRLIIYGVFDSDSSIYRDYLGNSIVIFVPLSLSMLIAFMAIIINVFYFNIICCLEDSDFSYNPTSNRKKLLQMMAQVFDFSPYLVSNILYRISSLVIMTSIFNAYASIPIIIAIVFYLIIIILSKNFQSEKILMTFMVLTCPIWLNNRKEKAIKLAQFSQLWYQTILCFAVYGASTAVIICMINYSQSFKVDANLIFDKDTITIFALMNICIGASTILNGWKGKVKLSHVSRITKILRMMVFSVLVICLLIFPMIGLLQVNYGKFMYKLFDVMYFYISFWSIL